MFKNLTIYRFPAATADAIRCLTVPAVLDDDSTGLPYELSGHLSDEQLRPIGPMELHTAGWVSPYGSSDDRLFQQVGGCIMLTLGGESKVLPPAAVAAATSKRVADIEAQTGNALGRRARQRVKDEVVVDMLPRAFTAPSRLGGYLDLARGILAVDTASRKAADEFVSHFRRTLGSFPALPLNAEECPRSVLTTWLCSGDPIPGTVALGTECEISDSADGPKWKGKNEALHMVDPSVTSHIHAGGQCSRLAIEYDSRLSFTFGDDLVIRKLRFLDGALDKLDLDGDDAAAEADARFALLAGEVGALFDVLAEAFKFSGADE